MIQIDPKSQRSWEVEQEILELEVTDAKTFVTRGEKVHLFKREEMWADLDYTSFEQWATANDLSISSAKRAEQFFDIYAERFGFSRDLLEGQVVKVGNKNFFKPIGAKKAGELCTAGEKLWRLVVGRFDLSHDGEFVTQLGMTFDLSYRRLTGSLLAERSAWIETHRAEQFEQAKQIARQLLINAALMTTAQLKAYIKEREGRKDDDPDSGQNGSGGGVTFQRVYQGVVYPENIRSFDSVEDFMKYYELDKIPDGERLRLEVFWIREPGAVEHEQFLTEQDRSEDDDGLQFEDF